MIIINNVEYNNIYYDNKANSNFIRVMGKQNTNGN